MSQKQQQGEEGTSFDGMRSKKYPFFKRLKLGVMDPQGLQSQIMTRVVESCFRPIVREEVESAVRKYMISVERKDILPFGSRSLRLQFLNAISLPVFTRTRIQSEGCVPIEVALVDAPTGQVVSSGPGSSAKVKIVVLEGDFGGDEGENWTLEEFNKNIVREREGKKPLLTGQDVILTLKDGKGLATDISFTDNSCWIRSRKFRLGARLVDDMDGARIREAISGPFIVKNYPRNSCMKHYPPSVSDEVWRLENIRKAGPFHKRLSEKRVNTVQDFLLLLSLDATTLRNIIGTTMSTKEWRVTVQHAQTCILEKTLYSYSESTSLQTNSVVFNVVGEVMGMFKDGQFVNIDKLSKAEKAHAHELVISAHEHRDKILTLNEETSLNPPPNLLPSSSTDHQDFSSHNITRSTFLQQHDASSSDFMSLLCNIGVFPRFDSLPHNLDAMDINYNQPLSFPNQISNTLINQHLNYFEAERLNYSEADGAINDFTPCSAVQINKARRGWDVLLSVLRWRLSIKRIVARKTRVWAI